MNAKQFNAAALKMKQNEKGVARKLSRRLTKTKRDGGVALIITKKSWNLFFGREINK